MSSKSNADIIISVVILLLAFFLMQSMQHVLGSIRDYSFPLLSSSSSSSFFSSLLVKQIASTFDYHNIGLSSYINNSNNGILTIVTVSNNGSFLPGATYSISSYPSNGSKNFTVRDDGPEDLNKITTGIISVSGLQGGNYLVTELKAPEGYSIDRLSKFIRITANESTASATFTNIPLNQNQQRNNSPIRSITYTAKFECGSIVGNEGPLRPGHYDTDISIFNRQEYPINILLSFAVNGGANTNSIVKTLQPQTSTAIICKDVRQFIGSENNSKELIEGFAIIRLDVNDGVIGSLSSFTGGGIVIPSSPVMEEDINNFLDVQVFYTANALDFLPHEILVKEIAFSILNDSSSKIPRSLLMKPLDITVQSQLNEISDPESKIRTILSQSYRLSENELSGLQIKVINVSIGVAAMIDDHAISSTIVRPEAST